MNSETDNILFLELYEGNKLIEKTIITNTRNRNNKEKVNQNK